MKRLALESRHIPGSLAVILVCVVMGFSDFSMKMNDNNQEKMSMMSLGNASLLKGVEIPMFDGNLKEFLKWKKDFNRIVAQIVGNDSYFVVKCLKGEPLSEVRFLQTFEEIMERLEDKYGDSHKLLVLINYEI